jgi:DNA-directed RNA polymerase specialized sigma54-like protein
MRGIRIARRTVAKYRNILNILPSAKRNIWFMILKMYTNRRRF